MCDSSADAGDKFITSLGVRLRDQRLRRQLTLQEVERLTGGSIRYTVLGSYERGERTPGIRRIMQLADLYRVPVETLLHSPEELSRRTQRRERFEHERRRAAFRLDSLQQAPEEANVLAQFVEGVRDVRDEYSGDILTIRTDDVMTMSTIYRTSLSDLWQRMTEWGVLAHSR